VLEITWRIGIRVAVASLRKVVTLGAGLPLPGTEGHDYIIVRGMGFNHVGADFFEIARG
jgi:hypothetical protein